MSISLPRTELDPVWNADTFVTTKARPVCQLPASRGFETLPKMKISEKQ